MINKILVAYDNGSQSQKALDIAIELAISTKAEINIVASYKLPNYYSDVLPNIEDRTRNYYEEALKDAAEKVRKEGIEVHTEVLYDSPGESIVNYAEEKKVDLVVLGSNNRGPISRVFLGSVSNYVVQHAHCPVLVIK